ncbi:DUF3558 domain-containing protein [Streptomyces rugosispiralis]|uniref:DUF3558 domain-containing protein n=1 Tax=Streptomyces rugosispiralis TaxID=2967341 RepID=A0ABT1VD69_9ACTN|nr:DUF3558 domain-containing protein [Streptomyces rugosispiralis]MCQ8194893.1 DUF3558 domain-containing protein [Streptomyces rugosispiralis]
MQPAQRRAYGRRATPAVAVLITVLAAAGLGACTGSDSTTDPDDGASGDSGTAVSAEPGRYRTLPEACGAVSRKTLQALLPGAEQDDKVYDGQASVTYDIDRRDGCRWKVETSSGTRYLTIDFQRVVSYDPSVSDDDRAQETYEKKAAAADIPDATSPPSSPSGSESGSGGSGGASDDSGSSASASSSADEPGKSSKGDKGDEAGKGDKTGDGGKSTDSPSVGADASGGSDESDTASTDTAPRRLDDLGDDAFLNDQLITKDSGIHRDITVVFRSSNVIATIEYDQWTTDKKHIPSSQELQENAQDLADELTGRLNE